MPAGGTTQVYNVPVVFQDLRQPEAYFQITDALDNLDKVAEGVFNSISSRVKQESERMNGIMGRLGVAKARVRHIKETMHSKATTVLSPNKHPSGAAFQDYVPLYNDTDPNPPSRASYNLVACPHLPAGNARDPISDVAILTETSAAPTTSQIQEWDGLGRLPEHVPSLTSLLLFNTLENPYNVYMTVDNLLGQDYIEEDAEDANKLADAPTTVATGEEMQLLSMIEYSYRPVLGDVPEFDLPDALPGMDMVAGDISWANQIPEFNPIAPSAEINLPALPSVIDPAAMDLSLPALPDTGPSAGGPPPPPPPSAGGPPPPPPPAPTSGGPPPPPPPPPPGGDAPMAGGPPPPPPPPLANLPSEIAAPTSGRSSLLEDIRKGKQLRSAGAKRHRKKPASRKEEDAGPAKRAAENPADIMDHLRLAISRRKMSMAGNLTATKKTRRGGGGDGGDQNISMPTPDDDDGNWSE